MFHPTIVMRKVNTTTQNYYYLCQFQGKILKKLKAIATILNIVEIKPLLNLLVLIYLYSILFIFNFYLL